MNATVPSSAPTLEPDISEIPGWLLAVHATIVAILLVASLVGNSITLLLVAKYKKLRYRSILVSLGVVVADLLLPLVLHFQALASSVAGRWPFGDGGCTGYGFLLLCVYYARWLGTAVIAIDRFLIILAPFFYRRWSKRLLIMMTVTAWIAPFIFALPVFFGFGTPKYRSTLTICVSDCGEDSLCTMVYSLEFGTYLILGAGVPTVLYLILYCFGVKKRRESLHPLGTQVTSAESTTVRRTSTTSILQTVRERRALITFGIIFVALILTQFPIFIISISRRTDFYQDIPIYVHYIIMYIYMLSTALDPVIVMRNRDFRIAFSHLVGRRNSIIDSPPISMTNGVSLAQPNL